MSAMRNGDTRVADLLAHTGWLGALARSLVSDEALAEDLVQESLLRAVERPPREPRALGAWLRTVLSRLAIRARAEGTSRERRERIAAREERSDSTPAEMLERVEIQGQVVDLVRGLEEPYRSAILLRYFEDWSVEDIARRQGVDATTVRWRIRKAVGCLRKRLDRLHGGRAAWGAALAPLLLAGRGAEAAAAASAGHLPVAARSCPTVLPRWALSGVAIMKAKSIAIGLVISLLLLGVLFHLAQRSVEEPAAPVARPAVAAVEPSPPLPAAVEATTPPPGTEPDAEPAPARKTGTAIAGQVSDSWTGEPIPGAVVRTRSEGPRAAADERGAYVLEGLPPGAHYLVASAEGHAEEHARAELGDEGEFLQDFRLEPAVELRVTVTDAAGGPIEGVRVTAAQPAGDYVHDGYARWTGADGKAVLSGIGRERRQQVNARKEGYREIWTRDYEVDPDRDHSELEIVLEKRLEGEAVVTGRVTGQAGEPLAGIHVQWSHSHGEEKGRVVTETARDGSYRLDFPRTEDWCAVSAFGEGWAPSIREGVRPGNAEEPARVDFTLAPGHWLAGEVVDEEGRPVEGASIVAMTTIYTLRNKTLYPGNAREARTDAKGRFSLRDLSGPTAALRVKGPRRGIVGGADGDWGNNYHPRVEVDRRVKLEILRWGMIRGRVRDRETGEPVPIFGIKLRKGTGYYDYSRTDPGEFFNSPEGRFALRKLDQGPIQFLVEADGYIPRWVRDAAALPEERAADHEVEITRGRFLDGIVVDGSSGAPLSGARVIFGALEGGSAAAAGGDDLAWDEGFFQRMIDRQERVTGEDGAFRVREGEPGTLFVRRAGYARLALAPPEWERLLVPPGSIRVPLEPGTSLSGVVFEDGKPSRNGLLVLYRMRPGAGEGRREWIGNLERDEAGRFRAGELTPGEHLIEHWRETPGKRTAGLSIQRVLRLEAGKENVLEFGIDLGTIAFHGRLVGEDGKPHERARLTLRPEFEWAYAELAATATREHDGRFHFVGLRPGRYRVEVAAGGKRTALPPLEIEEDTERNLAVGGE
jgi:RNA polymerase sigma-70 factor (ECF subfamily)